MPANPAPIATPHQRALIATGSMVVLLALFGWLGYWYGNQAASDTEDQAGIATTNTTTAGANNADTTNKAVVVGKITRVLGEAIEIATTTDGAAKTVTASVTAKTPVRKLDLRTIPKNGIGDGTAITFGELKVGNNVVVNTAEAMSSNIKASKVSLVIYP
ncbi:MAG: hypothetical protein AAB445_02795 [Patescibacteria group bacterium]